jgi:EAL domain-containing protein (putative c-di-GMP-specific phosphodiesterase class I)
VLDNFGTGYSSPSWLQQQPFGAIKIGRSFIRGLGENSRDQAIVAAVMGMARGLGCIVAAEGVETEEQLSALLALQCERAQGFLLARPVPVEELAALLTRRSQLATAR